MRVVLINPPHPYLKDPTSQAPLGLLYVAAALEKQGVPVTITDLATRSYDEEYDIPEADLYGFTGTIIDRVPITKVAQQIKARNPDALTLVGGPISLAADQLDRQYIDSVVVGEGEHVIFDVLEDAQSSGKIQPVYRAERITDLDALPHPARHLIEHQGGNIFAYGKNYKDGGSAVIITGRGCPYNCAFCASPGIWRRKVVYRSVPGVLAEVDELQSKYDIHQLRFSDDTFTLKKERVFEMCQGLKERDVRWRASIRTVPHDLDMFQAMYDGGCREVAFGVESFDPDVLKKMLKKATPDDNAQAIRNAHEAGLTVRVLFMIGTPGESERTVDLNIEALDQLPYDTIALTNFIPIPGSAIADYPEDFGCIIRDTDIDHYNFYLWGPEGENKWRDLISLDDLSDDKLRDNRERMKQYVIQSGKVNRG